MGSCGDTGVKCGCWLLTLVSVFVVVFVLSTALLATGTRLRDDMSQAGLVSGFKKERWSLSESRVIQTASGSWVAVWKGPYRKYSVIRNILAVYADQEYAQEDLTKAQLNITYTVMCPPSHAPLLDYPSVASLSAVCMLDVETTEYLQRVHGIAVYGTNALLAIGSLALVGALFGVLLVCIGKGWCYCCGGWCPQKPPHSHTPDANTYTIGADEEE